MGKLDLNSYDPNMATAMFNSLTRETIEKYALMREFMTFKFSTCTDVNVIEFFLLC